MSSFKNDIETAILQGPLRTIKPRLTTVFERLELAEEVCRYVIEFEESDWENQIVNNEDVSQHPFTLAYRALYGDDAYIEKLKDVST